MVGLFEQCSVILSPNFAETVIRFGEIFGKPLYKFLGKRHKSLKISSGIQISSNSGKDYLTSGKPRNRALISGDWVLSNNARYISYSTLILQLNKR